MKPSLEITHQFSSFLHYVSYFLISPVYFTPQRDNNRDRGMTGTMLRSKMLTWKLLGMNILGDFVKKRSAQSSLCIGGNVTIMNGFICSVLNQEHISFDHVCMFKSQQRRFYLIIQTSLHFIGLKFQLEFVPVKLHDISWTAWDVESTHFFCVCNWFFY